MARYSIAEARNQFPKLVKLAMQGEDVTITCRGEVVARIASANPIGEPIDLEWLRAHRITPSAGPLDIVETIRAMRDEYPY